MIEKYYKVITEDMKSLGLRKNPTILTYSINEWICSPNISNDNKDSGGIWCCEKLSAAKSLKKYFESRYGGARIFECSIGDVLFQNSYRTKTNKIYLTNEIK